MALCPCLNTAERIAKSRKPTWLALACMTSKSHCDGLWSARGPYIVYQRCVTHATRARRVLSYHVQQLVPIYFGSRDSSIQVPGKRKATLGYNGHGGASKLGFRLHVSARGPYIVPCRGGTRAIRCLHCDHSQLKQLVPIYFGSRDSFIQVPGKRKSMLGYNGQWCKQIRLPIACLGTQRTHRSMPWCYTRNPGTSWCLLPCSTASPQCSWFIFYIAFTAGTDRNCVH